MIGGSEFQDVNGVWWRREPDGSWFIRRADEWVPMKKPPLSRRQGLKLSAMWGVGILAVAILFAVLVPTMR